MKRPYRILIDKPGIYRMRNGRNVWIYEIKENGASFPCAGHSLKPDSIGRMRRRFDTWALSGYHGGNQNRDIVAFVGAAA